MQSASWLTNRPEAFCAPLSEDTPRLFLAFGQAVHIIALLQDEAATDRGSLH